MGSELLKTFFGIILLGAGLYMFISLTIKWLKHKGYLQRVKWKEKKVDYVDVNKIDKIIEDNPKE